MYELKKELSNASNYIENPIDLEEDSTIYGAKCSGCKSCGGGCYGCRVTDDMLEGKLKD